MPLSWLKRSYLYKSNPQIPRFLKQIAKFREPATIVNLENTLLKNHRFLSNRSSNWKMTHNELNSASIGPILNKNHVSYFQDSSSLAHNIPRKFVSPYLPRFSLKTVNHELELTCVIWRLEPWLLQLLIHKITHQTIIIKIMHNSL